jgi:hypothetical protein
MIFSANLGVEFDPPRGARGVLALARAIERHLCIASEEQDERLFVELAGAYFGLLLCDALGGGRHENRGGQHGLCFGEHGFFDPFAAIEKALDADDVRDALAQHVALAETLARGDVEPSRSNAWAQAESKILPRLVGPRFLAELGPAGTSQTLCAYPLAGEVQLCFVLRERARARYVQRDEPERWAQRPAQLRRTALTNLARQSKDVRLLRFDGERGTFVTASTGDGLDAARLMLPGLHDVLSPELGSPFAAAIPHRDALFACRLDASGALEAMRERATHEANKARLPITSELFLVEPEGRLSPLLG